MEAVQSQLNDVLAIVPERQKDYVGGDSKRQKIGLKAFEVGLRPIALIADEIGSIRGSDGLKTS